jgi:hypothetical protein
MGVERPAKCHVSVCNQSGAHSFPSSWDTGGNSTGKTRTRTPRRRRVGLFGTPSPSMVSPVAKGAAVMVTWHYVGLLEWPHGWRNGWRNGTLSDAFLHWKRRVTDYTRVCVSTGARRTALARLPTKVAQTVRPSSSPTGRVRRGCKSAEQRE